jgi:sensor histidine kinase YesM
MTAISLKTIRIHIIAWAAFIAYEILVMIPADNGRLSNFWDDAANYTVYILLFYFNAHVALSWTMLGEKKRYFTYFLLLVIQFIVYIGFKYLILYFFNRFNVELYPAFTNNSNYVMSAIYRFVYFLGFSTAYWFAIATLQNRRKIADLANEQLKDKINKKMLESAIVSTENAYLKSQINPHFLFNTLNFIYNSVSKFNETTADSVMTLSEIMRYALSDTDDNGEVLLAAEIEHIENFVKLNQARFNQRLCIEFNVYGEVTDQRIIPLIFITLVENIFKYGNLNDPLSPALIILKVNEGGLTFQTENLKRKPNNVISHGIGIENLKRRLSPQYHFELKIDDDEQFYRSLLKIWY